MMNNILSMINQFKSNPMALLSQKFNIPANITDPQAIIQHLLNSGQINQNQLNSVMQMRNNPMFKGLF